MSEVADRIEKRIRLDAPQRRVWRALADTAEFGAWFGVRLSGPWKVGAKMRGSFDALPAQAQIDALLAQKGLPPSPIATTIPDVFCVVEALEPESYFRFRWIPYGIDAGIDPETEPTTIVEFRLVPDGNGTILTVTESGFERVPLARRRRAFLMNTGGWEAQLANVARHLGALVPEARS